MKKLSDKEMKGFFKFYSDVIILNEKLWIVHNLLFGKRKRTKSSKYYMRR